DASHCSNLGMRTLEDHYKCIVFKELRKVWEKNCHLSTHESFLLLTSTQTRMTIP
ncbi:hypothetical protein Tco_1248963, partial [Tanacetum coccineum]